MLYYNNGFVKKFPLARPVLTLGRDDRNDLVIEDEFLSRKHLEIKVEDDYIIIRDLESTNGTLVDDQPISEARINLNESFTLGGIEFYLKKGSIREFKAVKELVPYFNKLESQNKNRANKEETLYIQNIYHETLKQVLRSGLKTNDFSDFLLELSGYLSFLNAPGAFFLVSKQSNDFTLTLSVSRKSEFLNVLKRILKSNKKIFVRELSGVKIAKEKFCFWSYPINTGREPSSFIYITSQTDTVKNQKMEKFLNTLYREIILVSQLFIEAKSSRAGNYSVGMDTVASVDGPVNIVAASHQMQELIKQARKIALSDLFILIQGESGTGKELFARLIHHHSKRKNQKFVAINCAAIPETLLESELFGYEKGAFTGAYRNSQGKLELASGGTLVLDEIGNMAPNLQSKLLRALQEYEFYRLGGTEAKKVDLRIISLTNSPLDMLLRDNKIREDLYYRLAHHIISIPSLRQRKEDISALINHFTKIYAKKINKKIQGYSIEAFQALQAYDWPGNVRQLENEINRLVNLCDDGDMIPLELISYQITIKGKAVTGIQDYTYSNQGKNERELIIRLLKENRGNKSKTARQMGMTYQGLHKKMKRLGMVKP